jgi:hypothetical protein
MRFVGTVIASGALMIAGLPVGAATFTPGEFITYDQSEYGHDKFGDPFDSQVSAILENNFDTVFAPFEDLLQVGVPGPAGYSMIFDSPDALLAYLPAGGSPAPLTADLLDPLTSASGFFGGEVVDATLNLDFSNAGLLAHPTGVTFGDLVFQNLGSLVGTPFVNTIDPEIADLDGLPIHEVLSEANLVRVASPTRTALAPLISKLPFMSRTMPSKTVCCPPQPSWTVRFSRRPLI